jgi:hypothetical protein
MKLLITAIFLSIAGAAFAQSYPLEGDVFADDSSPLVYSSVVLLHPADSTMQAFGITNKEGHFEIKNIKKGEYLLQIAFLGFETHYRKILVPVEGNNLGSVALKSKPVDVDEVKVVGEYVPLAINKDTIEYNAAAFKLKPDAVTEDLLRKLPGVEVDRAGNIKAMGEDVSKLFVDGKEFFGNDPKVATKNVPADAVEKVQVYDRKSEESMFTGIDDGSREKAINLQLKEDKKNALFGDVMAGGGTGEHWQGSAKAYRFTDKIQTAVLGMANNINQFGFSFNDYMNFSGGIGSMIHGSGSAQIRITSDGSFPINFGLPVSGLNTSGAGGANFSYSTSPNDRVFISYLGSGSEKKLEQTTKSWNYTENSSFLQNENLNETDKNAAHNFNFGWRNRIDSTQNMILNGDFSISSGKADRLSTTESSANGNPVNTIRNLTGNNSDRISGKTSGSYIKTINRGNTVVKATGNVSLSQALAKNLIGTETSFFENGEWQSAQDNKFQDDQTESLNYSLGATLTQKAGRLFYLEPELVAGSSVETLDRTQGLPLQGNFVIDSLSPAFEKRYRWFRPKISWIRNTAKTKLTLSLQMENGKLENSLNGDDLSRNNFTALLPGFLWEYEYQSGRRLVLNYVSNVNTPSATQLLPVVNNINPLALYYGNPALEPEKAQNINMHWLLFDQFSFTSVMATFNGTFTKNKINWDRTINNDLSIINTLINVDADYKMRGNFDFSTPIRSWGIKIHFNLEETWNQGLNLINGAENKYTNLGHRVSFSFDNRKKEKWDVNTGVEVSLTHSEYSVQKSLNNRYFDMSWFGEVRFTPGDNWNFEVNADVANYSDRSFGESVSIPLLGAEVSHFFLKNNRGTLTLRGFDLLNQNRIVERFSELNYLREIRSNSIGRFVMLSFTYRLNQFGNQSKGVEVKMRR